MSNTSSTPPQTQTQAQVNRAILLHLQALTKEAQRQTKELKKHSKELGRNRRLISLGVAWALFLGLNLGVAFWNALASSPAGRLLGIQEVAQVEEVSRSSVAMDTTPLKRGDKVGQWTVTSGFGPRSSPCPGCSSNHMGVDLNTPVGVPLFIPYDGRVSCSWSDGGGTIATLTGGGPKLRLVHLSRCTPGEFRRGERVAVSGNTGSATTGPHLHYEEFSGGAPINPTRGWVEAVLGVSSSGGGGGGVGATEKAVEMIKGFEGFHPRPYWDVSQWTWGYGTRAPGATGTITREQADRDLRAYLDRHCWPRIPATLQPHQAAALASLCYNIGPAQFAGSDALRYANAGNHSAAAAAFGRWTRAGGKQLQGLVNRRAQERATYEGRR